jgi:phage tail sheath protein FI
MADKFLHGVEVLEVATGVRPIETVKSSIVGIVGTAPGADSVAFPLNKPILITGDIKQAIPLGIDGTLYSAIESIFEQKNAIVVVVRVDEGVDFNATLSNVVGGVDGITGDKTGLEALLDSESVTTAKPRIILAPEYSDQVVCANKMNEVAEKLRGMAVVDAPNLTTTDAVTYAASFDHDRVYICYPKVVVFKNGVEESRWLSPFVAGMMVKMDNERGFWHSPSNQNINGIIGTEKPIDFSLSDANSTANFLNEKRVNTVVNLNGYKLWGNRTTAANLKKVFVNVARTADIIADSVERAHVYAVDKNITANYFESVSDSVNAYLRNLQSKGAILGGLCWANSENNTTYDIQLGIANFSFDFQPPTPAESVHFTYSLNEDYFNNIFNVA